MSEGERRALIFGVSGQDGSYLAHLLLGKGYRVFGTSRAGTPDPHANLRRLGAATLPEIIRTDPADLTAVGDAICCGADRNPRRPMRSGA